MVSPPVLPRSPLSPCAPSAPVEPVIPVEPVAPVAPFSAGAPGAPCGPAGPGTATTAGAEGTTTVGRSQALNASADSAVATTIEYFMMILPMCWTRTECGIARSRPNFSVSCTHRQCDGSPRPLMHGHLAMRNRATHFACGFLRRASSRLCPFSFHPTCPRQVWAPAHAARPLRAVGVATAA